MKYKKGHIDVMHEVVVPISDKNDAKKTIKELQYFEPDHINIIYVAPNTEQTPKSIEQEISDELESIISDVFPDSNFYSVRSSDTIDSIINLAMRVDATSIVFRPDDESFLSNMFSKNKNMKLITHSSIPVIALPDPQDME